jgi:hypothetical protein
VRRAVDVLLVSACFGAVGLEIGLRALAAVRPSTLLARSSMEPRTVLERNRTKPGNLHFGVPFNAGGHYDVAFERRRDGEHRIATIGDSFSTGVVPHAFHYTTVAERELGFPVDNLGVPGIGISEYTQLFVDEALPLRPELVVIAVFVGNDIITHPRTVLDPGLRGWFEREQVLIALVPARLARIAEEERRRGDGRAAATVQGATSERSIVTAADLEKRYPWTGDYALEEETMSEASFVEVEAGRAKIACAPDLHWRYGFERYCTQLFAAAAGTPLAVMLIPDDFQVEDDLWEKVRAFHSDVALDRDQPQRVITSFLEAQGIPCLDLLPVMRAVPREADGRRHLYHLRDTHWNARGNALAGEALAGFVGPLLEKAR